MRRLTLGRYLGMLERKRELFRESLYGDALIASIIANTHRDPKKRSKPYTPEDFLPKLGAASEGPQHKRLAECAPEQTPEQMYAILRALFGEEKSEPKLLEAPQ